MGRPEIEIVIEFSSDYLKKLREEKKPCPLRRPAAHLEHRGMLPRRYRQMVVREPVFKHFHKSHPNGDRKLAKSTMPNVGPMLPVGKWNVEFANGVAEMCEIRDRGTAYVVEPLRSSSGKVAVENGSFMIRFEDDRVERWTPVGTRMVVEHWFPGSQIAEAKPVLGVADRAR